MVVRGAGGLDEISLAGPTRVVELREDGELAEYELTPASLGIARGDNGALEIGDLDGAKRMLVDAPGMPVMTPEELFGGADGTPEATPAP